MRKIARGNKEIAIAGLRYVAWVFFGSAVLAFGFLVDSGDLLFLISAFASIAAGFVFLAFSRIIELLEQIAMRDAVNAGAAQPVDAETHDLITPRSIEEIERDLQALKAK